MKWEKKHTHISSDGQANVDWVQEKTQHRIESNMDIEGVNKRKICLYACVYVNIFYSHDAHTQAKVP